MTCHFVRPTLGCVSVGENRGGRNDLLRNTALLLLQRASGGGADLSADRVARYYKFNAAICLPA